MNLRVLADRLGMTSEQLNNWVWASVPIPDSDGIYMSVRDDINKVSDGELVGNFGLSVTFGPCSFNRFDACETIPGENELTVQEVKQAFSDAVTVVTLGRTWDAVSPAVPLAMGAVLLTVLGVRAHAWMARHKHA